MAKKLLSALLRLVAIAVGTTSAFVAPTVQQSHWAWQSQPGAQSHSQSASASASGPTHQVVPSSSSGVVGLSLSSSPDHNTPSGGGEGFFPKARTDIRYFLTQRSIQSFVYLLNQCREEHTVRWLEKTLDFTSIDNFHGTGAFNQTRFPEWDSVFLDCVDRPEEIMVMQIRSRRRQQRLSGYNAYFESLKKPQPQSPSSGGDDDDATTTSKASPASKPDSTPSAGNRRVFSAQSYLDSMGSTPPPPSGPAPKNSWQPPNRKTNRRLSDASSYLEHLSAGPPPPTNKDGSTRESSSSSSSSIPSRRTFGPGKSTSYLEFLSGASSSSSTDPNTPSASAGEQPTTKSREEKTQQSSEPSKNPYLEESITEYEFSVDPPSLVRRILSVREQISKEWVEDLDMLSKLNDEIAEFLEEHNKATAKTDEEEEEDDEEDDTIESLTETEEEQAAASDHANDEDLSEMDLLLKSLIASDNGKRQTAFDRNILSSWTQLLWSPKRSSSPYRKANFDLLLLLATQESIHRVLHYYQEDDTVRPETHQWLLDFYKENVGKYFDGHQTYARGEDFLEQMMKSPRTLIETNNEFLAWVDPAIIAEDIVRERSEVTLHWMTIAETISEEHTDLRRMLFTNMVSKPTPDEASVDTIVTAVNIANITASESSTKVFGAFE
eukprot:CAMPEP_0172390518 /NCGR_PEP_ID=MMETSP1061-20121228/7143_1 /TAXON_ID=37318 /ORGANISM="Pseudo-nitzschia pungens, Strain cf. pungens" /LENGTH=663 /DNA_ID=CAMNT_0013120917 /DNA_START=230 /DNA_END=2221 /DNA_ORIENTATION=+